MTSLYCMRKCNGTNLFQISGRAVEYQQVARHSGVHPKENAPEEKKL